jgi:demethylmenaquinone methyltransferase/2-methoxy-6-polyprenyl-1,4-benzoquinol methylase
MTSGWNQKRKIMHDYDYSASVYDVQYGEEQEAKIEAALDEVRLGKSSLVLDVGCGTGLLFPHIATDVDFLVGLDFSRKILKQAWKRAKQYGNVAILQADADFLPFSDETFNHVFAITILQNIPDPLRCLQEIKRVAKSEATVIVTGLKKEFSMERLKQLLKRACLKISLMKMDEQLKGYVAVCRQKPADYA